MTQETKSLNDVEDIAKFCYELGVLHQQGHPALVAEQDMNGHMCIVNRGIEWAEQFSKLHEHTDWDSVDWYLEVDEFIDGKLNELAREWDVDMSDFDGTVDGFIAKCSKGKDNQLTGDSGRVHSCK